MNMKSCFKANNLLIEGLEPKECNYLRKTKINSTQGAPLVREDSMYQALGNKSFLKVFCFFNILEIHSSPRKSINSKREISPRKDFCKSVLIPA